MKKINDNKAVTIIALVITIIMLLILAGITINAIIGDNSLIKRAEQASNAAELADVKEEVMNKWFEVKNKNLRHHYTNDTWAEKFKAKLNETDNAANVTYNIDPTGTRSGATKITGTEIIDGDTYNTVYFVN